MVGGFQSCTKSLMVERRGESFDSTKYNRGLAFANHQVRGLFWAGKARITFTCSHSARV